METADAGVCEGFQAVPRRLFCQSCLTPSREEEDGEGADAQGVRSHLRCKGGTWPAGSSPVRSIKRWVWQHALAERQPVALYLYEFVGPLSP